MRSSGSRVSDILKQAIDVLYDRTQKSEGHSDKLFKRAGFVGCGDGPEDLSLRYKEELEKTVATKHGHR